jgi:DNA-damage-inducible protein J
MVKENTVTMTMRVDPELKRQAEVLCGDMGLTMSAAYNVFLKALVRERAIPFKVAAADPFYSDSNIKHLKRAISRLDAGNGKEHALVEITND